LIASHGDRYLPGNKTISRKFLGREAKFPEGPFLLAAKFKVPVSFVFAFKSSDTEYQLYGSPKLELFADGNKDPGVLLDAYIKELEAKLKLYPEQWFNYFYFWEKGGK
jgi:predicted LPLAT superfamily acyltransferase